MCLCVRAPVFVSVRASVCPDACKALKAVTSYPGAASLVPSMVKRIKNVLARKGDMTSH